MPTPSTRTPVRIARGSYSNLNSSISDLGDGEIVYAEDQDKLYVKEGSSLVVLTQPAASPTFTGTVTIPTPTAGDNSTVAASTAFVVASFANLASPTFTGTPTLPTGTVAVTQSAGNSTTAIATTAFVATSFAPLASPTLTGTPAAPTASANTNTTQIATTAFVMTELGDYATLAAPAFTGTATGVNLTLSGNLTVNGTTTTIDTTNLDVEDKNITLGKVSTPTDTTADGGGITLKGATDKTWNWVDATDAWTSSEHIHLGDNKKLLVGDSSDLEIYHDSNNSYVHNTNNGQNLVLQSDYMTFRTNQVNENILLAVPNGSVKIYHNGLERIETTAAGVTVTGTVTDTKGDVRSIPNNHTTSAYTLVLADAGKCVTNTTGGVTVNTSIFSGGDAVTIINHSGSDITITQGSSMTIYNTADAATGNRTLAGRGMATLYFTANNIAYISGAGLS